MPLVVSEADPNDKNQVWMNKLVGKTIHDEETTETVRCPNTPFSA